MAKKKFVAVIQSYLETKGFIFNSINGTIHVQISEIHQYYSYISIHVQTLK